MFSVTFKKFRGEFQYNIVRPDLSAKWGTVRTLQDVFTIAEREEREWENKEQKKDEV